MKLSKPWNIKRIYIANGQVSWSWQMLKHVKFLNLKGRSCTQVCNASKDHVHKINTGIKCIKETESSINYLFMLKLITETKLKDPRASVWIPSYFIDKSSFTIFSSFFLASKENRRFYEIFSFHYFKWFKIYL